MQQKRKNIYLPQQNRPPGHSLGVSSQIPRLKKDFAVRLRGRYHGFGSRKATPEVIKNRKSACRSSHAKRIGQRQRSVLYFEKFLFLDARYNCHCEYLLRAEFQIHFRF